MNAYSIIQIVHHKTKQCNPKFAFGSGTELHLNPGPTCIWVWDWITFGSGTKSHLDPGPNGIWVREWIAFESRNESHLGPGLNYIWIWDQTPFWSVTEWHLGPGVNRIWVRDRIPLGTGHTHKQTDWLTDKLTNKLTYPVYRLPRLQQGVKRVTMSKCHKAWPKSSSHRY